MNVYNVKDLLTEMADKYYYMRMFLQNREKRNIQKLKDELEDRYGYFYWEDGAECRIEWGATKAVLIVPDWNCVIKIPINGEYGNGTDYCKYEKENYSYAVQHGLDRYFAPCKSSFTYHFNPMDYDDCDYSLIIDVPVYIMDYAEVDVRMNEEYESQSDLYNTSEDVEYTSDDLDIIRIFSNFYTDEEIEEFIFFLKEYNINDIHDANIGMINGLPVLIDYSGYF